MQLRLFLGILLGGMLLFTGCDSNRVFEKNFPVPEGKWEAGAKVMFPVENIDSLQFYNLYINLRNTSDYPYNNLYLFLETRLPDNRQSRDTIEIILADASGKWLGSGLGDVYDNQILFRRKFRFPVSGRYEFFLEQAMRDEVLKEVIDIGLRIEKAN